MHAADKFALVLEGDMKFEIEGRVHHPPPGEELLIPAGARHSARNIGFTTAAGSTMAWEERRSGCAGRQIGPAIEQAEKQMAEYRAPVVIEIILERVTDISMAPRSTM